MLKSATAGVQFMDYVGNRAGDPALPRKTFSFSAIFRSCQHETITGGTVTVGMERSAVQGGRVVRSNVPL